MLLAKTPRALAALQAGSRSGLSLRERRALILADAATASAKTGAPVRV